MLDRPTWLPRERRSESQCCETCALTQQQIEAIALEIEDIKSWYQSHQEKLEQLMLLHDDLKKIIGLLRWLAMSVKIITTLGGAFLGILLFVREFLPIIRGTLK